MTAQQSMKGFTMHSDFLASSDFALPNGVVNTITRRSRLSDGERKFREIASTTPLAPLCIIKYAWEQMSWSHHRYWLSSIRWCSSVGIISIHFIAYHLVSGMSFIIKSRYFWRSYKIIDLLLIVSGERTSAPVEYDVKHGNKRALCIMRKRSETILISREIT